MRTNIAPLPATDTTTGVPVMQAISNNFTNSVALHILIRTRKTLRIPCKFEGYGLQETLEVSKVGCVM